jgi:glycerol-3-phosphate acyltransferase PlsY
MLFTIIASLLAYLLGSVSSAIIVCRLAGLPDPRQEGSKNPGATNVLRLGGKKLAFITLFGDALKGFIPVFLVMLINNNPWIVGSVMVAVFLGHLYPIFFGFEGGKGVATFFGILFALSGWVGLMAVATWGIVAYFFRMSSLAALATAFMAPIYVWAVLNTQYAIPVEILAALIFYRHRGNISRIRQGIEPKIGQKKKIDETTKSV